LQSEVEETLKRIHAHKGVLGVIVVNSEGIPISTKTTWDTAVTVRRLAPNRFSCIDVATWS
jgi:dynein light chain roadblock-type